MASFALNTEENLENQEPSTYAEVVSGPNRQKCLLVMEDEMESPRKNDTWVLVEKPKGQRLMGCKWNYKQNKGIPGSKVPRFKARLVVKGFTLLEGVEYNEIYSPVVRHTSIRVLLAFVVQFDMFLE